MSRHILSAQPSREEFLAWQENGTTQWVFQALTEASQAQREAWATASWIKSDPNPLLLAELKSRSDAYMAPVESSYEDFCALNGDDPTVGDEA